MRFGFFVHEAIRAMRRNAAPSFAALATVLVTMLVVGVFIPAVEVTNDAANTVRGRLIVDVYMRTSATTADEARVRKEILGVPHVKSVQFESKAQAYRQQASQNQAAYQLLGGVNPLPDTFHVIPDNPANVLAIHRALTPGGQPLDSTIQSVSNKQSYTKKALELTSAVKWGGLAFAALLTIASILLIANTIRLSLYARRREVEVMKLVGATDWFIRWPFVIEGIIVGTVGGIMAIVVLGVTKVALLDPLFSGWSLVSQIRTIAFPALIAVLLLASAFVSAVGSGLSLRRFLRV
ncbi:MAG TPA: permease-like cell division protein FtsX [Solirubrobacteraceae bacterium]|nr:permease-like cell division protein FtsX [Solirubrobacteraceae bacterium]